MEKKRNFPFPSRVEGFLDCCGEYQLWIIQLPKKYSATDNASVAIKHDERF